MDYVLIEYKAPSVYNDTVPLYIYAYPLRIIKEDAETVTVYYEPNEQAFTFFKKNIERRL